MTTKENDIDLTKVHFPTDGLTVKDLRRLFPGKLDYRGLGALEAIEKGSVLDKLASLLTEERTLVIHAYDEARGDHRDFGVYGDDLDEAFEELAATYIELGVATGPAHAQEHVRSLLKQARQQAESARGTGR